MRSWTSICWQTWRTSNPCTTPQFTKTLLKFPKYRICVKPTQSFQQSICFTIIHSLFISYITQSLMFQFEPVNQKPLESQVRNLKNGFTGREEGNGRMISLVFDRPPRKNAGNQQECQRSGNQTGINHKHCAGLGFLLQPLCWLFPFPSFVWGEQSGRRTVLGKVAR